MQLPYKTPLFLLYKSSTGPASWREALTFPVENVGVNHGSFHVLLAEEFFNGPDIVAAFQKLGGEGMMEVVRAVAFCP